VWGQKLNQHAGMMRVQMLDQNERHAGVGRHVAQEGSEGSKPPADAPIPTIRLSFGQWGTAIPRVRDALLVLPLDVPMT
jgi:hypothetical protein